MDRRTFLISTVGGTPILAGCTGSGNDPGGDESSNGDGTGAAPSEGDTPEDGTETESEPDYDVAIDYSTHVQSSAFGEYDLPDPQYDDWSWLVVDIDVREGQLDMADLWFNGFFETEERLHDIAHDSSDVEAGVESRGVIRQGGRGVVLHDYPPTPRGEVVGWNASAMEQSVGGEGVITDGPNERYPPVSVEYSVETTTDMDFLPDRYARQRADSEVWAVVSIEVIAGFLNMADVWFRSQLATESRLHDLSHSSTHAERGIRSRGMVKPGCSANALYLIGEQETVEEWGYTEDGRQDASISRV